MHGRTRARARIASHARAHEAVLQGYRLIGSEEWIEESKQGVRAETGGEATRDARLGAGKKPG